MGSPHLFEPNEACSTRIELHLIELLAKGVERESLNNPDYRLLSINWQQNFHC